MADVSLRAIKKSFGKVEILHGISLDVMDGEFVVFVGPSGCGKSTALRIIAGLEEITSGELYIGGKLVNQIPPAERGIAMVFQSYALYPHMTVYKNMAFGLKFAKTDKDAADKRVRQAAEILQLTPYLDRKPRDLSGGQRQRVAIGRAIVREPAVFLFDEPLSNLDAALRINTRIEIAKLHRQLNATTIYVTHDQVEAMTLASKIVVMNQGRVEQVGAPLELYHHPQNQFVAGFIGSPKMNFVKATVTAADASGLTVDFGEAKPMSIPFGGTTAKTGDSVTLGIRPEHLGEGAGHAMVLTGTVEAVEHLGEASYVHVRRDDGVILTARSPGDSRAEIGAKAAVSTDIAHLHLFDAQGQAFARHSKADAA
ncbi:ABC transporter ATP-binding protein [Dongia sedimenti]|uniref:Sn-glycerol-3-phosphate ABC transporter ATP-binding protein UgpC n=1 Tax=Dongia sedimenti TaxID=3064282 RepID=A0ABU0YK89_9PROT|nr:sn-glycerol-3-phosphate ABC transporter ATP-binding protein UgpC [Rhodospirillaceae bacterium R-7]